MYVDIYVCVAPLCSPDVRKGDALDCAKWKGTRAEYRGGQLKGKGLRRFHGLGFRTTACACPVKFHLDLESPESSHALCPYVRPSRI